MSRNENGKLGLMLMGLGFITFHKSFKNMRLQQKIKDTSTSKIASAALGDCVEIQGRVIPELQHIIRSPLSEKECIAFVWTLEKEVRRRRSTSWELVHRLYSTPFFYISDDSQGIAAVDLASCSFQEELNSHQVEFRDGGFSIPQKAQELLGSHKMIDTGRGFFSGSGRYRLTEKVILPGQELYLLGAANIVPKEERPASKTAFDKFGSRAKDLKAKVQSILHVRKSNQSVFAKYDLDKNRRLDSRELAALERDIENEVRLKFGQPLDYLRRSKFLMCSPKHDSKFLGLNYVFVSTRPQTELASSLATGSFRDLILGPALIVAGLWILMSEHKIKASNYLDF